jgi:hypothetical protein
LISKGEMRDEGESVDLQRGDDSKNHRNLYKCTLLAQGKGQQPISMAATIPVGKSKAILRA